MKKILIATGIVTALSVHGYSARAAEINAQGAEALKNSIGSFLPEKARAGSILSVTPAGDSYSISYDFAKLIDAIDRKDFTVSGLTPFVLRAMPVENGRWKLDSTGNTNVTASGKAPDGKQTEVTYSVSDMMFSGIFDPAISYLRSAQARSGPIRILSTSGPEAIEVSVAGTEYSLSSAESGLAGGIDFKASGSLQRFYERIEAPQMPPVRIRADSAIIDATVNGVMAEKVRNLMSFVFDLVKDEKPSAAEIDRLKGLIRDAMPFFTAFYEKISFNQFTVESPTGDFGVGKLDYTLTMTEPSDATRIGLGARLENITTPSALVPPVFAQLIPDVADIEVGVADLNFRRFVDTLMEMDLAKGPLPKAESERLGRAFLDDGQLTIDFPRVIARSSLYDLEASGKIRGNPEMKDDYTMEATVFARDIDKLIQHLQKAGRADKQLSQASFGLMLAKGMAKTEPDGRLRWDLKFEDGQSFSVNGQVLR